MDIRTLLGRYRSLHKQHLEIDAEMKDVEQQIISIENVDGTRDVQQHRLPPTAPSTASLMAEGSDSADRATSPPALSEPPPPSLAPTEQPPVTDAPKKVSANTRRMVEGTVAAIREVGGGRPIFRRELAVQLGLSDYATTHRLRRLREMGVVKRVDHARYTVVDDLPEL